MNSSGQCNSQSKSMLGIIGGTGMETFPELQVVSKHNPVTKYGKPSDEVLLCEYKGRQIAFVPRHGSTHVLPPHKIPYKANLAALKELGVTHVIGTCVVGSLKKGLPPGAFVIPDQFVNLTWGRDGEFREDGGFIHLPMGDPYCSTVRKALTAHAQATGFSLQPMGTVVVTQGPRFSTKAESKWYSAQGWDIINMTQYPECYFAKELGLCYAAVASVTDYDAGLYQEEVIDPEHAERFLKVFRANTAKTREFLLGFAESRFAELSCACASRVVRAYYETV